MSIALQIDLRDLERLSRRLRKAARARTRQLMDNVGLYLVGSTQERIESDKATPDGQAWDEWSEAYRNTRQGRHSLLINEGDLLDSMTHDASDDRVLVGSNLPYARVQDEKRQYLGISPEDEAEIDELVDRWFVEAIA